MKYLLPALAIVGICSLSSGTSSAQRADTRSWDPPAWVFARAQGASVSYQDYVDQRSRRAPDAAGINERLVAISYGWGSASGTVAKSDSIRFWYSDIRGMEKSPNVSVFASPLYHPERQFDSAMHYGWIQSQGVYTPDERFRKSFDSRNRCSGYTKSKIGFNSWVDTHTGTTSFSVGGKDSVISELATSSSYASSMYVLTQNSAGDLTSKLTRTFDAGSGTWVDFFRMDYKYDAGGRPSQLDYFRNVGPQGLQNQDRTLFEYTASGKFRSLSILVGFGTAWNTQTQWVSYYNGNDQEIARVQRRGEGIADWMTQDSFAVTSMNAAGLPLSGILYISDGVSFRPLYRNTYTYDSRGLQLSLIEEGWNGTAFVNRARTLNTYTATGRMETEERASWDGGTSSWWTGNGSPIRRYYWESYQAKVPGLPGMLQVLIAPVPASGQLQVILGNATPAPVRAVIYNSSGQVAGSWPELIRNGSGTIDVSGLPPGLYRLQLLAGEQSWTGSFNVIH